MGDDVEDEVDGTVDGEKAAETAAPAPAPDAADPEDSAPQSAAPDDAEERHAGHRGSLLDQLRRPSPSQLVGAVLVGLLGFATVTQVHSRSADDEYSGLREADLIQVLNGLTAQSRRAENEITSLEETRSKLTDSTQRRQAAADRAQEEASTLGILAGTTPAIGPGVRITVTDPEGKVSLNNLLDAVEELRAAGAEAMEFDDDVRVVASTSFEQTDEGLLVDGRVVPAPYVIEAIGNPDTLASAVDFAEGFSYDVEQSGGDVTIDKRTEIAIRAVVEPADPDFAQPRD